MKVLVLLGLVALGCGAEGGSAGGDAGAEVCRAPQGCRAVVRNGVCLYDCTSLRPIPTVCVPLPDGGVASQADFTPVGVPPADIAGMPYAADFRSDPANCTGCGRRCAANETCGIAPGANVPDCYRR